MLLSASFHHFISLLIGERSSTSLSVFYVTGRQSGPEWLLSEPACSICHWVIVGNTLGNLAVTFVWDLPHSCLVFFDIFPHPSFSFTEFVSDSPYIVIWSYRSSVIFNATYISDFHSLSLFNLCVSVSTEKYWRYEMDFNTFILVCLKIIFIYTSTCNKQSLPPKKSNHKSPLLHLHINKSFYSKLPTYSEVKNTMKVYVYYSVAHWKYQCKF